MCPHAKLQGLPTQEPEAPANPVGMLLSPCAPLPAWPNSQRTQVGSVETSTCASGKATGTDWEKDTQSFQTGRKMLLACAPRTHTYLH